MRRLRWIPVLAALIVAAAPARAGSLRKGEPLPPAPLKAGDGAALTWNDLGGDGPLVVVFWATWCKVCRKDWPKLREIAERYEDAPAPPTWIPIGIADSAEKTLATAKEWQLPGRVITDPNEEIAGALGVRYVPTVCVLDSEGRLVYSGKPDMKKIDRLLRTLAEVDPS